MHTRRSVTVSEYHKLSVFNILLFEQRWRLQMPFIILNILMETLNTLFMVLLMVLSYISRPIRISTLNNLNQTPTNNLLLLILHRPYCFFYSLLVQLFNGSVRTVE